MYPLGVSVGRVACEVSSANFPFLETRAPPAAFLAGLFSPEPETLCLSEIEEQLPDHVGSRCTNQSQTLSEPVSWTRAGKGENRVHVISPGIRQTSFFPFFPAQVNKDPVRTGRISSAKGENHCRHGNKRTHSPFVDSLISSCKEERAERKEMIG